MDRELDLRKQVLERLLRRYLLADRAWMQATAEMRTWFPPGSRPPSASIGNAGSPIRRAYDLRERALQRLEAARWQFRQARQQTLRAAFTSRRVELLLPGTDRRG